MIREFHRNDTTQVYTVNKEAGVLCVEYDKYNTMTDVYPVTIPRIKYRLSLAGTFLSEDMIANMLDDETVVNIHVR